MTRRIAGLATFLCVAAIGIAGCTGNGPVSGTPNAPLPRTLVLPTPASAKDDAPYPPARYTVKVNRDSPVGERYRATIRSTLHLLLVWKTPGQPDTGMRVEHETVFAGTGEVKSVDEHGQEKEYAYTVETLRRKTDKGAVSLP